MRIGMVLLNDEGFPPDIRVQKEARALSQAGHEVFVLAQSSPRHHKTTEWSAEAACTVTRVNFDRRRWAPHYILLKLLFAPKSYRDAIARFASKFSIDVLHAHDLYAVASTLKGAKQASPSRSLPVVADLHENMPAAERAYRSGRRGVRWVVSALLHNYRWMQLRESRLLKRCEHVILVVEESADRLRSYGIEESRITVVSNTEDETTFNCGPVPENGGGPAAAGPFTVSYVGGIGPHRGLGTTIRGFALAHSQNEHLRLRIVGVKQRRDQDALVEEIQRLGLSDVVTLTPWVPADEVPQLLRSSAVCLVPHEDFEHTQTTVPHKLFQYMLCARPILASDCRPLARIIEETGAGLIFRAGSADSFADRLLWMSQHPVDVAAMGERGRAAATSSHSWQHDRARLLNLYDGLRTRAASRRGRIA